MKNFCLKLMHFLVSIPLFAQAEQPALEEGNLSNRTKERCSQHERINMKNKRVLISGAGIAGLTLAYWLKQYGFTPILIEKHPTLRAEGYKLDIRGVAVEVVRRMGLEEEIFESRTKIRRAIFVDDLGKHLTETHPDLCGVRAGGDLEIVRSNLCQILFKQVGDIECLFGDSITKISQGEMGVYVEFEKNEPQFFDLVVGADGIHSKVRNLVWGDESQFLRELGLYISFYSIPNFLNLDSVEIECHSPRRFIIAYCPPNGLAKVGFAFSSQRPQLDLRDQSQQQKFLQDAFNGAGWEVPRFLSFMKDAPDFYFDCIAQIHMPHWTEGRVALVGDSGYAVSPIAGQGASVALVGAYVLAGELAEANGDYNRAFPSYERYLSEFIKKNQELAKLSVTLMEGSSLSWIESTMVWMSHNLYRLLPGSLIQFFKNWGLRQTTKAANALILKNYSDDKLKGREIISE